MPTIDHIAIQVNDMQESIAFYTHTLGFSLLFSEVDLEHHEAFAFLQAHGSQIELLQQLDADNNPIPLQPRETGPPYCPHIAILSDNIDRLAFELIDRGISIVKGPMEIPGKVKWLYISDPDGNMLEYVQWL